jgi:VCBS repeat-containing protein
MFVSDGADAAAGESADDDGGAGGPKKGGGGGGRAGKNFAPQANSDGFAMDENGSIGGNVLANDSDRNGDPLTVTAIDGRSASVGTKIALNSGAELTLNADGSFGYDTNGAFDALTSGQQAIDTFTYSISDGRGGTDTATVTMTINGVSDPGANSAPNAVNDSYGTDEDTAKSGNVLGNDTDPDTDPLTVTAVNGGTAGVGKTLTLGSGAKLTLNANGAFTYTPNGAFDGLDTGEQAKDSFTYTISDGHGGSDTATVTLTIAGVTDVSSPPAPDLPDGVDDLLLSSGQRWNAGEPYGTGATVSYSFLDATPNYYSGSDWASNDFRPFTAAQEAATRAILDNIESFADITFVETGPGDAAITFGNAYISSGGGYTYYPSGSGIGSRAGDVWINTKFWSYTNSPAEGNYGWMILEHEIGHAVGLDHVDTLSGAEDSRAYTVMSYNQSAYTGGLEPATMQLYDVAAIQHIYGANTGHATGNTLYTFGSKRVETVWDADGVDTFDGSGLSGALTFDLRPGAFSSVAGASRNLSIAIGTVIENAKGGSGNDTLIGNGVSNVLAGGAGDDNLTGGAGGDTFAFGLNWGRDVVTDFTRGSDLLDLRDTGLGFANLAVTSSGGNTIVAHGADQITLNGVDHVTVDDFWFTGMA